MSTLALFEDGKRVERIEYAVRYLTRGPGDARKGDIEECSEHKARWLTAQSTQDELPYCGYPKDGLELVTRTVVTYYGDWHQEPADSAFSGGGPGHGQADYPEERD